MRFITLLAVAVAAVSAAPLVRREAPILDHLRTINDGVINLEEKVEDYDGGALFDALHVKKAAKKLNKKVNDATSEMQNFPIMDSDDSQGVIDYITQVMEPSVSDTMSALTDKEEKFTKADLTGVVNKQLTNSQAKVDTLGKEMVDKMVADKQGDAQAALAEIDGLFAAEIETFSDS
ncbi:hypothetical protein LTR36_010605 [Oleoguttula mirabilis]|uniref:Hydrophobic surface binding protein A-domain-containing protein n=1 Tax=Oleoguttula mirabilis TaxID=1507867 RepID=A0AAV9JR10_9PEZI|nr:hypothetical protein LTR36_010605 [Oleoguttula mirabilis]